MFNYGRKASVPEEELLQLYSENIDKVFLEDGRIRSKTDEVWNELAAKLNGRLSARTLYSKLCDQKIREKLNKPSTRVRKEQVSKADSTGDSESNLEVSKNVLKFSFEISKQNYENLIIENEENRNCNRKNYIRYGYKLKAGDWEDVVSEGIYRETKLKCGFNFKNHYITTDKQRGNINGYCTCGCELTCNIDNFTYKNCTSFKCTVKQENCNRKCRKRYLKNPKRFEIAKILLTKPAGVYRTEQSAKEMNPGDPEPPYLPNLDVLKTALCEYKKELHLDKDPRRAIEIMKHTSLSNVIHNISFSPFSVHFWTRTQTLVYLDYAKSSNASICIDASGSIVKKIIIMDNIKSSTIYLYIIVMHTESGQLSVAQMLSSSHNTISILFFLLEWSRLGAPHPKEVTCDASEALLTAVIRAFTGCFTIDEYAASYERGLPSCYVRIDGAHFINNYVKLLKSSKKPSRIRLFYKAALGQLIVSRNYKEAERILRALLIICTAETDGFIDGTSDETQAEKEKKFILSIIDPNYDKAKEDLDEPTFPRPEHDNIFDGKEETSNKFSSQSPNKWSKMSKTLEEEANKIALMEIGDHDNAHYLPEFGTKLVQDMKWFELWSCISRDRYGYGKIPASSSAVECEFNKIKTKFLHEQTLPMRVDDFLELFAGTYLRGSTNLYIAKDLEASSEVSDEFSEELSLKSQNPQNSFEEDEEVIQKSSNNSDSCVVSAEGDNTAFQKSENSLTENKDIFEESSPNHPNPEDSSEKDGASKKTLNNAKKPKNSLKENKVISEKPATSSQKPKNLLSEEKKVLKNSSMTLRKSKNSLNKNMDISKKPSTSSEKPKNIINEDKITVPKTQESTNFEDSSEEEIDIHQKSSITCQRPESLSRVEKFCQICNQNKTINKEELCESCNDIDSIQTIVASRKYEDWRCLASADLKKNENTIASRTKSGKTSKYFDKNSATFDALGHDELKKIPIMLNGSTNTLMAINIKKMSYSFVQTCAIDSLIQIMTVGLFDHSHIRSLFINLQSQTPIFKLILDISKRGINSHSYKKRGEILLEIMSEFGPEKVKHIDKMLYEVDCAINVNVLANKLFRSLPSFEVTSMCNKCSLIKKRQWRSLMLHYEDIYNGKDIQSFIFPNFKEIVCTKNCQGLVKRSFTSNGPFAFIEVDMQNEDLIELQRIPKHFADIVNRNDTYHLLGLVHFIGRNSSSNQMVGHYTAICLRQNQWLQYDDLSNSKASKLSETTKVNPALIIYVRKDKV